MARRKIRVSEEEIKQEILNMSKREIQRETKYIIEFEDEGQDFLTFFINEKGYILDSKPCQRWLWAGKFTIPQVVKIGEQLPIWLDGENYIKYPIKNIEITPLKESKANRRAE